ncbi:ABC transporter ATP-binding protein [Aminobacter sp. UC22_36]|uniref:ABC transporter ATP-binding protein n=1 Tax=Aminobacter sp. UC22_36 TaxID=3374549 RepID=UPI003757C6C3
MAYVELRNLEKAFGTAKTIHGISAEVKQGEFVVILGPSGCGKSTTLRMIAGLEEATGGEIHIAGRRVDHLPPKDRGCAMVFQNYALYPHLTVRGNIEYGLRVARMPASQRAAKVREVATLLELDQLLDRKPGQLSGGQRQRVAIARAIAREPNVFLFDEPLSNLDAKLRTTMRTELRKLHDRLGATSIFVTHDQVEAMTLADKIIVMNKGTIAQIGSPSAIYHTPADLFVAGFVGTPPMNIIQGRVSGSDSIALANGWSLSRPRSGAGLADNQPVAVGIRAENLVVSDAELDATIDFVEDIGAQKLLHCIAGANPVIALDLSRRTFRRGDNIKLKVRDDDVSLFSNEERRISAAV